MANANQRSPDQGPAPRRRPRPSGAAWRLLAAVLLAALAAGGCARYNTFYNAEKAFKDAERARQEAVEQGQDVGQATSAQRENYLRAISKAQKMMEMYPGHGLTDDALFLQGKAHHRLASYRMSIRQLDLLFTNFPRSPHQEEALFLQAVNFLMINDAARSQDLLDLLERQFPRSRFQAEALRASGDNAFALKDWESAVAAYRRYLERYPSGTDWDASSLQLAQALWELERYGEAALVLERVRDGSPLADRVFRARVLLSRCRVRLGELDTAEAMVAALKNEAEIYEQQGMVQLIEAEILLARGQRGTAVAMLEGLPADQLTREIKPVWADMLGHAYLADEGLDRANLEKAREYFQQAVGGATLLRDPERTRRLLGTLRDYLAADNQLVDAQPERAARLRLLQANALLFGFERPRLAFDLFTALAADTAADSTIVPRALYGAMLLQESYFDQPDSAARFAEELIARYPDSPQAYRVQSGAGADLLTFLLAKEQSALLARAPDRDQSVGPQSRPGATFGSGLRRRMIYLQRRPHLVFPPPPAALQAQTDRRQREAADRQATAPPATAATSPAATPSPGPMTPGSTAIRGGEVPDATDLPPDTVSIQPDTAGIRRDTAGIAADDSLAVAPIDSAAIGIPAPAVPDTAATAEPPPAPETKPAPKPERPRRWDL